MEQITQLLQQAMPFVSLFLGGAFFKFVLDILKWRKKNRVEKDIQDRLYEIAFRRCEAHLKSIIQYAVAAASAHADPTISPAVVTAYLEILSRALGGVDPNTHVWVMHPYPDFLREARAEIALSEQTAESEAKPDAG